MAAHLRVDRYGDFQLTDAIRPAVDLQVVPRQGYRLGHYRDPWAGVNVPVLAASVSREQLFDLFLGLLEPLGPAVDVVLETSHASGGASHRDLLREEIDLPVLLSYFCDFEDLLLNDGCTGVAVVGLDEPVEIQFDEHKLLIVYARNVKPFEQILRRAGVRRDDRMRLITEGEHLHTTDLRYADALSQLACRLGVGEMAEHINNW